MKKVYRWENSTSGTFFKKYDANKVGAEIETLGDDVTPENVVLLAKNEKSEMHNYFEWDDSKAGHLYRKQQAGVLLNKLQIEYVTEQSDEPVVVKAYVNLKQNMEYQKIETVITDVDKYQMLKEKAYKELRSVRDRYAEIEEIRERLAFLDEV